MTVPIMNMQQHVQQVNPYSVRGCTDLSAVAGATNTAATVVMPTPALDPNGNKPDNVIAQVFWSYAATPTGGRLQIGDGTSIFYDQDLVGTKGVETFTPPLKPAVQGNTLAATLSAGNAAGATAKVVVRGWVEL